MLKKTIPTSEQTGPLIEAYHAYQVQRYPWPKQGRPALLPKPPTAIPDGQLSLWQNVVRSANNTQLPPDLYVWRMTRARQSSELANDLHGPEAEQKVRATTESLLHHANSGTWTFLRLSKQFYHLLSWEIFLADTYKLDHSCPIEKVLRWGGALGDQGEPHLDPVFRYWICRQPPASLPDDAEAIPEQKLFRESLVWLSTGNHREQIMEHLCLAAAATIWMYRDIYAASNWFKSELIPHARKIFYEVICRREQPAPV